MKIDKKMIKNFIIRIKNLNNILSMIKQFVISPWWFVAYMFPDLFIIPKVKNSLSPSQTLKSLHLL